MYYSNQKLFVHCTHCIGHSNQDYKQFSSETGTKHRASRTMILCSSMNIPQLKPYEFPLSYFTLTHTKRISSVYIYRASFIVLYSQSLHGGACSELNYITTRAYPFITYSSRLQFYYCQNVLLYRRGGKSLTISLNRKSATATISLIFAALV